MWERKIPAKSTQVIPSETPHTLIFPKSTPRAITTEKTATVWAIPDPKKSSYNQFIPLFFKHREFSNNIDAKKALKPTLFLPNGQSLTRQSVVEKPHVRRDSERGRFPVRSLRFLSQPKKPRELARGQRQVCLLEKFYFAFSAISRK